MNFRIKLIALPAVLGLMAFAGIACVDPAESVVTPVPTAAPVPTTAPTPTPDVMVPKPTTDLLHGTFDFSDAIGENIDSGVTLFGINQQQPLQAYFSVLNLALLQRVGISPPSRVTNTGPALITKSNINTAPTRFVNEALRDGIAPLRGDGQDSSGGTSPLKYFAIQHGRCDWDTFWCTVEAGIRAAADDTGVDITILAPDSFDVAREAELLEQAIAAQPDGIMVTFPNDQLRSSIQRALDANIPVIVYNAGTGPINDNLGYLTYLGQDEYAGGFQGGQRLAAAAGAGNHKGICINQNVGQTSLRDRCQGFVDALREAGIPVAASQQAQEGVLGLSNTGAEAQQTISDFYAANQDVDIFLTLGPNGASPFYSFVDDQGLTDDQFEHGTFDFSPSIAENIRSGRTLFGIDQQPYLQGYGGLTWLYLISLYQVVPPDPVTATGPGFITTSNINLIPADAAGYKTAWERPLDITVVHHGEASNVWWDTMNKTIRLAAENIGVSANILVPTTFDLNQVRDLIEQAVAGQPDGLAVTVTDPVLFKGAIDRALAAGIPVVGFNAGNGPDEDGINYLTYIGQREYVGGFNGGQALAQVAPAGSKGICINQEVGHIGLDDRCRGFSDAMAEAGIPVAGNGVLAITNDLPSSVETITQFLASNPDVNIVFTLGPSAADAYYGYLQNR